MEKESKVNEKTDAKELKYILGIIMTKRSLRAYQTVIYYVDCYFRFNLLI